MMKTIICHYVCMWWVVVKLVTYDTSGDITPCSLVKFHWLNFTDPTKPC